MIQMYSYKVCSNCGKILPRTNEFFFKHKGGKDGLESQCKECVKKRRKKRYKNVIYEIYCEKTNIYYIGQTIKPITERISKHFSDAKRGRKQPMYEDMRKYERQTFSYKILEEVEKQEDLDDREKYYIKKYLDEGKALYNREYGGRKNIKVSEDTRREICKSKGTKEFLVFDSDGLFLGEFYSISQANKSLGYFDYNKYIDNTYLNSKDFIILSKENFNYDLLHKEVKAYRYLEDNIKYDEKTYHKGTWDVSGENNPMYGKHGKDNPNSKYVYVIKDNKIEGFESAAMAQDKYDCQVRYYARGNCNHYCKKLDIYIYYENLLPKRWRFDKDEVSYE